MQTDKSMFYDESLAKEIAAKFSAGSAIGDLKVYKCMFCDTWHLTKQKHKTRRKEQ